MTTETNKDLKGWSSKMKKHHNDIEISKTSIFSINKRKKFFTPKSIAIKSSMLIIIALCIYVDYYFIFRTQTPSYEDILVPVNLKDEDMEKISDYVRYITDTVRLKGLQGIDGKWLEGIPPFFKKNVKDKIDKLNAEGYIVEKISMDRSNLFNIKCQAMTPEKDIVFLEIAKTRVGNVYLFRLQRVY